MQQNWIGKSFGGELRFPVRKSTANRSCCGVFTTPR